MTKVEDNNYCENHAFMNNNRSSLAMGINKNMYRLQRYRSRLDEIKSSDEFKTITNEIGISRIMLEEFVNMCKDESDIMTHGARIADLAEKIVKQVTILTRMEKQNGLLMDKSAAIAMAGQIVTVISEEVSDASLVERISERIVDILNKAGDLDDLDEEK